MSEQINWNGAPSLARQVTNLEQERDELQMKLNDMQLRLSGALAKLPCLLEAIETISLATESGRDAVAKVIQIFIENEIKSDVSVSGLT